MSKRGKTEPWERQEGESTKAFEAFTIYLNMGADRSLRAVAEKLGKFRTLIERWSSSNAWVERVDAYDAFIQKKAQAEAIKDAVKKVRKMNDRHIGIALKLQEKAMAALAEMDPDEIDPKVLVAIIREATKLERESRAYILEDERMAAGSHTDNADDETDVVVYVPENGRDNGG